jgi:putative salt-induced outer membrane protein
MLKVAAPAFFTTFLFLVPTLASAQPAPPQPPPPPPPGWIGSAAAGLALTQGNSDTSTVNLAYDVKRDTGSRILFTSAGLFIRGESEGELTTNRLAFDARVDRKLNERTSVYGKGQYLRDSFKAIDYLISPTVGIGHFFVKNEATEFAVDAGVGVVWEKNPGVDVQTDGALTAGQQFSHKLTATTTLTEKLGALWKMDDFEDGLYAFGLGLSVSVTTTIQMKAEFLDTYKNKPPTADVKKNDIAVILSFVYKFD